MRRLVFVLFCIVLAAGAISARAQVLPSAERRKLTITVGGEGSVFQPDYAGNWNFQDLNPIAESSDYPLIGIGAYVDAKFTRWIQIEAEGRWLRFNQVDNIHQDTYLIGPRVPVYQFKNSTLYGKVLVGYGKMTLGPLGHGTFTDVAFGGGMDVRLTKKISLRAFDFEYQDWPKWANSSLHPYGGSVGIGYRVF